MAKKQKTFLTKFTFSSLPPLGMAFGALLFIFVSSVVAQSITNIDKAVDKRSDQIDEINDKINAYQKILELKKRQGATLGEQIQGLEAQTQNLGEQISFNQKELDDLNNEISQLQNRIDEKSALINQQKIILSELLRSYHQDFSQSITPALLTQDETVDYLNNANWNTDVSQKVSDLLDSVQTLRDGLAKEQQSVDEKKQSVNDLQEQLNARNEYLEASQNSKERLLGQTESEAQKYDTQIDSLEKEKEALEEEITDIEAGKINQLVGLPKGGSGVLGYPVKGGKLTQGYGKTSYSHKYASGKHNGIDIAASTGTKILSAGDGKVIGTGDLGRYAYGKWIAINHGNGLVTLYAHLSKISVSPGKSVDRGDTIGEVGSTGNSTGPHLHFTVYASKSYEVVPFNSAKGKKGPVGASVNPGKYLP
jgi:murein DD-endopeptidase MepM/ murein hydrolase activator NlpD